MNSETIHLNMNPNEADKIAHVLMASLGMPNMMLDSERVITTQAANDLFEQLNYGYKTNAKGERVETGKLQPSPVTGSADGINWLV
jgi:Tfp pilus assembly protein FimT